MSVYFTRRGFSGVKKGIESVSLSYPAPELNKGIIPTIAFTPLDADPPKSFHYEITSGRNATINPDTGLLTMTGAGTVAISLTVVDANGKTVTASTSLTLSRWEKWDIKTKYYFEKEMLNLYTLYMNGDLYFSDTRPTLNTSLFDTVEDTYGKPGWTGNFKQLFGFNTPQGSLYDNLPYTAKAGYYITKNDLRFGILSAYAKAREGCVFTLQNNDLIGSPRFSEVYYPNGPKEKKQKGDVSYGSVYAAPGTYPDNGEKSGYWYVKYK